MRATAKRGKGIRMVWSSLQSECGPNENGWVKVYAARQWKFVISDVRAVCATLRAYQMVCQSIASVRVSAVEIF